MKNLITIILCFVFFVGCVQYSSQWKQLQTSKGQIYHWKSGDSLEEIAARFGDDVLEIRIRNHIYEIEDLYEGFPLVVVPKKTTAPPRKKNPPSQLTRLQFSLPSKGSITSKYGNRRRSFHYGVDFGADKGKEIFASESGIVKRIGSRTGYGKTIEITHTRNIRSLYAHLDRILVRKGERVIKGQKIGIMGNTGRSTGVHLHFEIIVNGVNIDPLPILKK